MKFEIYVALVGRLRDRLQRLVGESKVVLKRSKNLIASLRGIDDWLRGDPRLDRNEESRFHELFEQCAAGQIATKESSARKSLDPVVLERGHSFVVRHDWSAALGAAIDGGAGDVALPYPVCYFEFVLNGRPVIVEAKQTPGEPIRYSTFVSAPPFWYASFDLNAEQLRSQRFARFLLRQIEAICVALDAEVAMSEPKRQPIGHDVRRTKSGEWVPIDGYHVVDLSRRSRSAGGPGEETGSKKRLHFRRGHWRHYETFKSWIKWTLVGNPDLGFVDKHYAL